jgi:hypothetical protein
VFVVGANESRDITVLSSSADRLYFHRAAVQVSLVRLVHVVLIVSRVVAIGVDKVEDLFKVGSLSH